jgi:cytoskeletal protein RodZ
MKSFTTVNYMDLKESKVENVESNQDIEERAIDVRNHIKDALVEEDKKDSKEFDEEHNSNLFHLMIVATITITCMLAWFVLSCKAKADEKKFE